MIVDIVATSIEHNVSWEQLNDLCDAMFCESFARGFDMSDKFLEHQVNDDNEGRGAFRPVLIQKVKTSE